MGYMYILLAAGLWGLIGPVSELAFHEGANPLEVAFFRALISGSMFILHAWLSRERPIARRDLPAVLLFGLVGVSLFYAAYQLAVRTGGAPVAAVLLYTAPAWVILMAAIWLGESIGAPKLLTAVLAIGGVAVMAFPAGGNAHLSAATLLWGLISGFSYALYYLFGKRYFLRYTPALFFAYAMPAGALGLLPLVHFDSIGAAGWGSILFISLVSTYLAYLLYGRGLVRLEAGRASIVATLEPVVASIVSYIWWDQGLTPIGYLGGLMVVGSAVLVSWSELVRFRRRV